MKTIFRTTAILNLLLVVSAFICTVIAAINKNGDFLAVSALTVLVSIFPTTMMLAFCNDFKDADKVIAEKDTKIIQLEAFIENYNRISGEIIDNANHQKYKRCLDNAKLCRLEQERIELIENQDITDDDFNKLVKGFYKKWRERWLKIAEQFREAK